MRNINENIKRCTQLRKDNLIKVFNSKCCLCGFDTYHSALEFHHVDPSKKVFGLSGSGLMKNMEDQLEEAKKCILVCANCHRGIHHEGLEIPSNWETLFDNNIATIILEEYYDKKQIHKHYCSICGIEISRWGEKCENCAKIAQRYTDRPNREELKKLIRTKSFVKIGEQYGVSDNAIRKWCKAENLPYKKSVINTYNDIEWLEI